MILFPPPWSFRCLLLYLNFFLLFFVCSFNCFYVCATKGVGVLSVCMCVCAVQVQVTPSSELTSARGCTASQPSCPPFLRVYLRVNWILCVGRQSLRLSSLEYAPIFRQLPQSVWTLEINFLILTFFFLLHQSPAAFCALPQFPLLSVEFLWNFFRSCIFGIPWIYCLCGI